MALPDRIQVRLSSEAAGSISITPVVNQIIPARDLIATVMATTGKDSTRVREVLLRGAVVQGASRYRWAPLQAQGEEIDALLRSFPDPDPRRPFRAETCIGVRLRAGRLVIEVPREIAAQRRLLKRRTFWDALLDLAAKSKLEYIDYSYRTQTDEYRLELTLPAAVALQDAAGLLRYSTLIAQLRENALGSVEYLVRFP